MQEVPARDTQFAGFAKLLLSEMLTQTQWNGMDFNSDDTEEVEKYSAIIARRAYDLSLHVMSHLTELEPHRIILTDEEQQAYLIETLDGVPDLTHWPEEVHDGSR